jgi:hypothetical protein
MNFFSIKALVNKIKKEQMNKKYHVFIEDKKISKKNILEIEKRQQEVLKSHSVKREALNKKKIKEKINLEHTFGRVIISINIEEKNSHTFSDGTKIYVGRQFNNLNRRETEPVNAYVISADGIPEGAEILIHPNSIHDSNKIFNFDSDISDVKYYSIPQENCYLWRVENEDWQPLKGYVTGLRVFKEYQGVLTGIDNELIKHVLYITSGELKGKVVHTLKACDYEIIYMGKSGIEERVIRCRHFEDEENEREEIIAIDDYLTDQVQLMNLMVGLSSKDAKYIAFTI